ncbi:MAG: metal-dependent hydrolase [Desulfovibrio sp.]|jgi:inner membrane protein|nr:metal-dependent hydrolase [Desulfovibrio sp.]
MASLLTHPAPAIAIAAAFGTKIISPRLAVAMVIAAVLPDMDVVGFSYGVKYASILGHRGFSHSLLFAFSIGLLAFLSARFLKAKRGIAFLAVFCAVISHIILDAATTGGLGVAVFWPVDETRYFLPWRPIEVSPFSLRRFFSSRGVVILLSELRWVWAPCAVFAFAGIFLRFSVGFPEAIHRKKRQRNM